MPLDRNDLRPQTDEAEYRRYREEKDKQRKKRRLQRLIVLGAFALGAILLVVFVVMIFRSIFSGDKPEAPSSVASVSGVVGSQQPGGEDPLPIPTADPIAADPDAWNLWLISPTYPVGEDFAAPGLLSYEQGDVVYYFNDANNGEVLTALEKMMFDCNTTFTSGNLMVYSGYRSYRYQTEQYNYYYNLYKEQGLDDAQAEAEAVKWTPKPGTSENHTGLAVDFITNMVLEPAAEFENTEQFAWLRDNCVNYGFILRYPADKYAITGVEYKPYHFRYVGVEAAQTISQMGITLEEYVGKAPVGGIPVQPESVAAEGEQTPEA